MSHTRHFFRTLKTIRVTSIVACSALSIAHSAQSQTPQTIDADFFGMHIHRVGEIDRWPRQSFGVLRLWDTKTSWRDLEPQRDRWDFSALDRALANAKARHVKVLLTLGNTPEWASARPNEKCSYGFGCAAEPNSLRAWERYVRTVVTRYKGQIECYEIWNEIRLPKAEDPSDPQGDANTYSGDLNSMIQLAKSAYKIVKEIDTRACVTTPSFHVYGDWIRKLDMYLEYGGREATDVVSFHFYATDPEDTLRSIDSVQRILAKHRLVNMPVWNTESGFEIENPSEPESKGGLPASFAPAYVARSMILAASRRVSRFYWYAWDNRKMGLSESLGKSTTLASEAFEQTRLWLNRAQVKNCSTNEQQIWVCNLTRRDGRYQIVWKQGPRGLPITGTYYPSYQITQTQDLSGNIEPRVSAQQNEGIRISHAPVLLKLAVQLLRPPTLGAISF